MMAKRPSSPSDSQSRPLGKKSRLGSEEAAISRRQQIREIRSMFQRRSEGVKNPLRMTINTNTSADTEYRLNHIRKQKGIKYPLTMDLYCRSDMDDDDMAMLVKDDRHRKAEDFRSNYTSTDGCNSGDKKTCISSYGTYRLEKSYGIGIMWVAVHGVDSICVVTNDNDKEKLDLTRSHGSFKCSTESDILDEFRETLVCEIEDLADPSCKMCRSSDLNHNIKKPFGVVSVISGIGKVHEENGHEISSAYYDEKTAIKFLEEKMKRGRAFSFDETVEAAISAFQHLFHRKFKAKDIRVCVLREASGVGCLCRSVVKEYLRVINEGTPRGIVDLGWKFVKV